MWYALFEKIAGLIEESRKKVSSAINIAEVYTKYNVGRYIIEHEQEGKYKAAYGKQVLIQLAERLKDKFGDGWTVDTLTRCRKFFNVYNTASISATALPKLEKVSETANFGNIVAEIQEYSSEPHKFVLSWSHYLILMRIPDANACIGHW